MLLQRKAGAGIKFSIDTYRLPLSCHARGLADVCTDCIGVTPSCVRSSDLVLMSGKKRNLDGRRRVGMASKLFRSYISTVVDFVTCIEFGLVGILV